MADANADRLLDEGRDDNDVDDDDRSSAVARVEPGSRIVEKTLVVRIDFHIRRMQ